MAARLPLGFVLRGFGLFEGEHHQMKAAWPLCSHWPYMMPCAKTLDPQPGHDVNTCYKSIIFTANTKGFFSADTRRFSQMVFCDLIVGVVDHRLRFFNAEVAEMRNLRDTVGASWLKTHRKSHQEPSFYEKRFEK